MSDAERIERLERVLGTLIVWMAQTANSPLSVDDCKELLRRLRSAQEKADEAE